MYQKISVWDLLAMDSREITVNQLYRQSYKTSSESTQDNISEENSTCVNIFTILSYFLMLITFPISLFFVFGVVKHYKRVIIFRMGRIRNKGAQGPGIFFYLPCIDYAVQVDLRTEFFDVPPQDVLTRDAVSVVVNAVVFYKIFDPMLAVLQIKRYDESTRLLAATILRNTIGLKSLNELLIDRDAICNEMRLAMDTATDPWGVKIERVEMKEISLQQNLQRVMAIEAETKRDANAKVITAQGEQNASEALSKAAEIMEKNPATIQLRYLQTLTNIAISQKSTILFPIDIT